MIATFTDVAKSPFASNATVTTSASGYSLRIRDVQCTQSVVFILIHIQKHVCATVRAAITSRTGIIQFLGTLWAGFSVRCARLVFRLPLVGDPFGPNQVF